MNEVLKTILERRSLRLFSERQIPAQDREALFNAAIRAPTAGNMMSYSIIDVTDPGKEDLEYMTPGEGDLLLAANDAIVAAQNVVIAAESLGLVSCYIGGFIENIEEHRGD